MNQCFAMSDKQINYSLFGLLLGDGYYKNGILATNHTSPQKEYVEWLAELFDYWGILSHVRYDYPLSNEFGDFLVSRVSCKVPSARHFEKFNRCYDSNGEKIISSYVMKRISSFGLLLWFLDDGCLTVAHKKSGSIARFATLCTHSFDYMSHVIAKKNLYDRFGIVIRIHKEKQYYKLYMSATNFRKFYDLVRHYLDFIPESMRYKFDMKYVPNRLLSSELFSTIYNGYS